LLPILLLTSLMTGDLECFSPISTKMHCNLVLSLSHLKIFYPFLLHEILTLTLIYSCQALITQPSLNTHATITCTEFTTPEAGILLHQPSSNPRTYNLRSILVHHSPMQPLCNVQCISRLYSTSTPTIRHPTVTQRSPSPHRTLILPSTTLIQHSSNPHQQPTLSPNPCQTLAQPSPNPLPTITQPSHIYSRPFSSL
jgi:hypothetical protein